MQDTVIIVGAGVSGLAAGAYLQMNGYKTEIFEMHNLPGGLCTSWERKGYIFDGCAHWLVGSGESNEYYELWNELIDMKMLDFVDHDIFIRHEDEDGKVLNFYTNIDKLEKELLEKAPEDKALILKFVKALRKLVHFPLFVKKAPEVSNIFDNIISFFKIIPYIITIGKWIRVTMYELAEQCKNELLKVAFKSIFIGNVNMFFIIMTLAWMHKKGAGYPIGGSLKISKLLEKRYLELGGKIHYNSKVSKVIIKDNCAVGVHLKDGKEYFAHRVISSADGYSTIFKMLEGKYINKKIKSWYSNYTVAPSCILISLGINKSFSDYEPLSRLSYPLKETLYIDDTISYDIIQVRILNFDTTIAPEGKTVISTLIPTSNGLYWNNLKINNNKKYQQEKKRIAEVFIDALEQRFGNIREHIEVTDVSTPATLMNYTDNWKGSTLGWEWNSKVGFQHMKKVLPGLKNFYMIGHWLETGGGLPRAMGSGRNVAQMICKKDRKKFETISFL